MNRNDIHYVVHNRLNHDCSCSPRQQMKMRQRKIDNDYCYHGAGVSDTIVAGTSDMSIVVAFVDGLVHP